MMTESKIIDNIAEQLSMVRSKEFQPVQTTYPCFLLSLRVVTLGAHAQRGYCSWVCLCVCVCLLLSISLHECLFVSQRIRPT
ncbi:hypothetical protein GBAR_LOCUS6650 [Geodia barretti]|uniref:Uncharacterized protein n=1 Tax=Geodia barretti TaxID=519541 RepID=A0AA35W7C0_GEOBA|nr:hypothetical protein GBAR_LOCUS6650 [Geodia barretti]